MTEQALASEVLDQFISDLIEFKEIIDGEDICNECAGKLLDRLPLGMEVVAHMVEHCQEHLPR